MSMNPTLRGTLKILRGILHAFRGPFPPLDYQSDAERLTKAIEKLTAELKHLTPPQL